MNIRNISIVFVAKFFDQFYIFCKSEPYAFYKHKLKLSNGWRTVPKCVYYGIAHLYNMHWYL